MKKSLVILLLVLMAFTVFAGAAMATELTPEEAAAAAALKHRQAIITLIVLAIAAVLFISEIIPLAVTAMSVPVVLNLAGVLTPAQAFSGLSNSNVILFAGMFIVGASLFETGVAAKIGNVVVKKAAGNATMLTLGIMTICAILSAVLSNTGTTAVLLPVSIGVASAAGWNRGRILMPLAMAASMGGTLSLVGTPPNLVVQGLLTQTPGIAGFGFFEFALVGGPMTIIGFAYLLTIGKRFIPDRPFTGDDPTVTTAATVVEVPMFKQVASSVIMLGVVVVMSFELIPLHVAATAAAILCVLTGTIEEKKAYRAIDWTTIFLFAGMLPLASAMANTGAGQMIADAVIGMMGDNAGPFTVLTVMFFLTSGLSQFMSNTASTTLLAPIALAIATGIGASPHGMLMTVAIAASCAFATPVGTPPNTLVLGPGGFTFMDYVKVGVPLIFIAYAVTAIFVPIFWPFF